MKDYKIGISCCNGKKTKSRSRSKQIDWEWRCLLETLPSITQFYSCIHGKKEKKNKILIHVEKSDMAGFINIFFY
jgi:hypothetical protein